MSACKSCEAPITWATTEAGKAMPLDEVPVWPRARRWLGPAVSGPTANPDPPVNLRGLLVVLNGNARAATTEDVRLFRALHTSHFATCPQAAKFRGKR